MYLLKIWKSDVTCKNYGKEINTKSNQNINKKNDISDLLDYLE